MEPQLKNKDRIGFLKRIRSNPDFKGSIIDVFNFEKHRVDNTMVQDNFMVQDNTMVQDNSIQELFQPYVEDLGWESGHTDFPQQTEVREDTRSIARKGIDRVKGAYRENVPESWKMFMPGFAEIEDARYVNEQWGPEGTVGGKVLSAGFMALPFVGSKALKGVGKSIGKSKVGDEMVESYLKKMNYEFTAKPSSVGYGAQQEVSDWFQGFMPEHKFNKIYGAKRGPIEQEKFLERVRKAKPLERKRMPEEGSSSLGFYNSQSNKVVLTPPLGYSDEALLSVGRHEYVHAGTGVGEKFDKELKNIIKKYIPTEEIAVSKHYHANPKVFMKDFTEGMNEVKYLLEPSEVYARVHELRVLSGGTSSAKFSQKHLNKALDKVKSFDRKDMTKVRNIIGDENLIKLMNSLPVIGASAYIGMKTNKTNK